MASEHDAQRLAGHVFHHDPLVAVIVGLEIEQPDQVRMFQVQALADPAQFNVAVAAHQFQSDFFTAVADREIDLAEAPRGRRRGLEGVTVEGPLSGTVGEAHGFTP